MKSHVSVIAISLIASACGTITSNQSNTNGNSANNAQSLPSAAQQAPAASPITPPSSNKINAAEDEKSIAVRFPKGATEASYTGTFSGYGVVDYKFDARGGQQLTAEITRSDGDKAVLTVMKDGLAVEGDSAMVQGWTGELPSNGSYVIRVGQMRDTARRGEEPVKFGLRIQIVD